MKGNAIGRRTVLGGAAAAAVAPAALRVGSDVDYPPATPKGGVSEYYNNVPEMPSSIRALINKSDDAREQMHRRPTINGLDVDIASMRSWSPAMMVLVQKTRTDARRNIVDRLHEEADEAITRWQNSLFGKIIPRE